MVSAIVAVDENWGIGYGNNLLENIPDDLKRFKELTLNHVVVMGRKTWDSLPKKPLPGRINIVISRQERQIKDGALFTSIEEIESRLKSLDKDDEWFIIGGGQIYKHLLPYYDQVYVTKIFKSYNNVDTFFPNLDLDGNWIRDYNQESKKLNYNNIEYQFQNYRRKSIEEK